MKKLIRILVKLLLVIVMPLFVFCMTAFSLSITPLMKVGIILVLILSSIGWSMVMHKTKLIPGVSTQKWLGLGFGFGYENKCLILVLPFIVLELSW